MPDEPNSSEKTTLPTPPSRSHQDGGSSHAGSWSYLEDENLFDMIYDDVAVEDLNSFSSRNWSTEDILSPSQLAMGYPSDPTGDGIQLIDPGLSTEITNSMSLPSAQGIARVPNKPFDRRPELSQPSLTPRCTAPLTAVSTMGILRDTAQSPNGPAFMQKLMMLGNTMYDVQSRYAHSEEGSRNALSETFPSELAGKVLHVAMQFRDSLRSLISADDPPDSIPVNHNSQSLFQGGPASLLDQSEVEDRMLYRHNEQFQAISDPTSRSRSDCTSLPSLSPSSPSLAPSENSYRHISAIDKPTTLQLVSNYLRLLQLYLLLFNAVHEHIRVPESRFHNRNPIWSDLSVGNVTLSQFADFQIKLVLQAAERVLEEIEDTLGLAEDSRVSKKLGKDGNKILKMNVTTHFIDICIRELTTVSEHGGGIIIKLRDFIHYFSLRLK
jgi:hypothetical protein